MAAIFPLVARGAFAARDAGGPDVMANGLWIGRTERYEPSDTAVGLRDPNPIKLSFPATSLTANQGTVVLPVTVPSASAITGLEVGVFSDNTLLILWSEPARNVFVKAANVQAIISIVWEYLGEGTPGGLELSVNVNLPLKATATEVEAGLNNTKYVTPLGFKTALDAILGTVVHFADTAEAKAGTAEDRVMSPKRTREAIDDRVPTLRPYASKAEAEAGTAEDRVMSPKRNQEHWDDSWVEVATEAAYDALTNKDISKIYYWD